VDKVYNTGNMDEKAAGKNRILVVEDNEDNLELVCFLLEQAGFEVLQAMDGRNALELASSHHPDMILLDMSIPEIDGWKVARQLKDHVDTQDIIIVALTGHTAPGDRKRALAAGCDGYITKPLDIPTFSTQVSELMKKHKKPA
jgi:two-component system cell cycle response regulator DivK